MPNVLTRLRVDEVSCVDRGAGEGVKIVLFKRDFSAKEREGAAESGAAMKDGSFPIKSKSDLHNAMQAVGRAKNPSAVKAHIRRRARALGLTGELSDAFKRESPMSFFQKLFARKAPADIHKSVAALAESVKSIVEDDEVDKSKLLAQSFDEFEKHIESVAAASAVDTGKSGKEGDPMDPDILKALGLAETADNGAVLKAIADLTKAKAKKPAPIKEKDEDEEAVDKAKKPFPPKDDEDEEEEEDEKKKIAKQIAALPAHVQKQLEEHAAMKKTVEKLQADADLANVRKIAADALMPDSAVEPLMKLYKSGGDVKAVDALVGMLKAANSALHASDLLKELGGAGSNVARTAMDELTAKALEIRKSDPKLTQAQAFAKAYTDPENVALVARERRENTPLAG